ncbi:MAG: pilus assembly PilX N-terminal domain-containing protein [Deltaproteobacteria bacterium]|nr:pilus assembly PilX N-terminal domain-containing protein [Deltaproteobacteria bacterium]MDH3773326.1 pilus assembly PilX N-terminal domain-containing protein [Deltaproteobacteria bacterium]MDH3801694.1 pilus assembly PilX N-terminal domain-containing protein [Deltaproteobacteria bacterium]MDH3850722.1 pilus assembly PilX N-terminal domain-containing protein [Deltaproteobacteria bacterium]MDH3898300.1 pilus assembly PilX N-terminal domain-containing protein [Deltaproteobacteria bacterium]
MEHKRISSKIKNLGLKRFLSRMVGNDRGVVLVFALVLMLVLTIIGSSATMTSQVDLKISGNTKVIRTSFYVADGGIMMSPKVIGRIITDRALPLAPETPLLAYDDYAAVGDDPVLLKKIMGFAMDSAYQSADDSTTDISMAQGTLGNMAIDITRTATQYLSGGGVEFAAGTEGVGVASAASAAIIYNLASRGTVGTSPKTTESDIVAQYRKVAGVAGGR